MPIWLWIVIAVVAVGGGFFVWKKFTAKGGNDNDAGSSETPASLEPSMPAETPEAPETPVEVPEMPAPETPTPEAPAMPESPSSEEKKPM